MNIINIIDIQLREILKLLQRDLKNSNVTYNYLVCENSTKFLDSISMKLYLTETKIENEALLNIICDYCVKIVELWNDDFEILSEKKLNKHFFYSDESTGKFFSSELDFHAIYLRSDKFEFFNTTYGKEEFVKNYDYKNFTVPEIASNCINIFNFIKRSYPKINSDFSPKYYFNHYKKTKRFTLQNILKPYSKSEFKEFEVNIENYLIRYKFILDNIDKVDKIEFKQDTLDHLKNIIDKQIHSKYNVLLNEAIEQIENNFQMTKTLLIEIPENIKPQQTETIKPDKVKKELHNHIFKDNAFEVWQSMFDEFEINEKSRTDVKFMFEEMKKDDLIHHTVNQTTFLEWIALTYDGMIVQKTSNHSRTKLRLQAYSRAIQLHKK